MNIGLSPVALVTICPKKLHRPLPKLSSTWTLFDQGQSASGLGRTTAREGENNGFRNAVLVFSGGSSRRGCSVAARSFDGPDADARYKLGSFDEEHGNYARRHGCRETIWQPRYGLREPDAAASSSGRRHGENGTSLWQRSPDASACAGSYYRPGIRNSVDAALAQPA